MRNPGLPEAPGRERSPYGYDSGAGLGRSGRLGFLVVFEPLSSTFHLCLTLGLAFCFFLDIWAKQISLQPFSLHSSIAPSCALQAQVTGGHWYPHLSCSHPRFVSFWVGFCSRSSSARHLLHTSVQHLPFISVQQWPSPCLLLCYYLETLTVLPSWNIAITGSSPPAGFSTLYSHITYSILQIVREDAIEN